MFSDDQIIAKSVWSIVKIPLLAFYNQLLLLIYMSGDKLILLIFASNAIPFISGSLLSKNIFQNTSCFMLVKAKKFLKLQIVSAYIFTIFDFLQLFNTIVAENPECSINIFEKILHQTY